MNLPTHSAHSRKRRSLIIFLGIVAALFIAIYVAMNAGPTVAVEGRVVKIERVEVVGGFSWEGYLIGSPDSSGVNGEVVYFSLGTDLALVSQVSAFVGRENPVRIRYRKIFLRNPFRGRTRNLVLGLD